MRLWRISNYGDLAGIGGLLASARWHNRGRPIVYCSEHPAGALVEFLVHIDIADLPDSFQLLTIEIDPDALALEVETLDLPENWMADPSVSRQAGDSWLARGESLLCRVPSVILPDVHNLLINPRHADAARLRIARTARVPLDPRLTRRP